MFKQLLLKRPLKWIIPFSSSQHHRSIKARKNIIESIVVRLVTILSSMVLIPLTIEYVDSTQYGIWLTLSSIISWFGFFDIGLGNGLRNKLGYSISVGDREASRGYISTAYFLLGGIIFGVLILFLLVNPFLNWSRILDAPLNQQNELSVLALIIFVFFCLQFVFQLINAVFNANQNSSLPFVISMVSGLVSLLLIFVIKLYFKGSIVILGIVLAGSPVIVLIIASFLFYSKKYKDLSPSYKYFNSSYTKDLFGLSIKYFIISISSLVVYQTTNILIAHICGPESVTVYNLAYKYLGLTIIGFGMILSPFWNAYTEALAMNDYEWMKVTLKKLKNAWVSFLIIGFVLLFISPWVYSLWFGSTVHIPLSVSVVVFIYVSLTNWCSIFSQISAGLGKIKLLLISAVVCGIINIPMSIYLGERLGLIGIVLSSCILSCLSAIWNPIQVNLLLQNKAQGIWNE